MPDRDPLIIKHWLGECQVWKSWKKGNRPHKNERTQTMSFFPSSNVYCIFSVVFPLLVPHPSTKTYFPLSKLNCGTKTRLGPNPTAGPWGHRHLSLEDNELGDHGKQGLWDGLQCRLILWILLGFTCLFLHHQMKNIRILTLQSLRRQRNCGD